MRTLNINNNSSIDAPRQPTSTLANRGSARTPKVPSSSPKSVKKPRPPPLKPTTATITTTTTTTTAKTTSSLSPASRPRPSPTTPRCVSGSASTLDLRASSRGYRDQNQHVLALRTSRSTISSAPKMPPGDSRPRQPQLSAAAAKNVGRAPLTPKIATKGTPTGAPLSRRPTFNQNSNSSSRDDVTAPSTPYLATSVTPRSGTRQNRGPSTNSTPSGTPNPDKHAEDWGQRGGTSGDTPESKFFYASDARSLQPAPPQRPLSVPQKPANFFYANGTSTQAKRVTSPPTSAPFTPASATTPEPTSNKFFYANAAPNASSKSSNQQSSGESSTISTAPRLKSSRPSLGSSTMSSHVPSAQRPMSPTKNNSQPGTPALKGSAMPPGPFNRPQLTSHPSHAALKSQRRVSIEVPPRIVRSHARTGSTPSLESVSTPRFPISPVTAHSESSSPPASPGFAQPAMTMASILQAAEDMADEHDLDDDENEEEADGECQSPTKSSNSKEEPLNDLVANARRERKVQDLQITNASLEAINRTLERQLRKQTAEIRRYKRLSRAGHLPGASAPASRVASEALSEPPVSLADLSDDDAFMSAEEGEDEPDSLEDTESSGTDSTPDGEPSEADAAKAASRQSRDEKRLKLDLAKHHELLVDSQKINQSLKRCLNWTEVLIKEGQKALEYKVRVSDLEFGGNILAPVGGDEDEDEDDESIDDISQIEDDTLKLADAELEPPREKSTQDRDSGIELSADGVKPLTSS